MSMPALPAPLLLPHVHPRFPLFPLHSPSCHLSVPPAPPPLPPCSSRSLLCLSPGLALSEAKGSFRDLNYQGCCSLHSCWC